MHMQLVILFAEEKNMGAEYESYDLVKFQDSVKASDQETSKRTIFLYIFKLYLKSVGFYWMMLFEQREKVIKP